MAATALGGFIFHKFRAPNAFVLGSLAVAIPLTAAQVDLSAMPQLASNAGQCLLGCALGSRFERDFLQGAHRFVSAVVGSILVAMALSALFGAGLAECPGCIRRRWSWARRPAASPRCASPPRCCNWACRW